MCLFTVLTGRWMRWTALLCLALGALGLVGGCRAAGRSTLPNGPIAAAAGNQIILEPEHGMEPIYSMLRSAKATLDLTMYGLVDDTAEQILVADAGRGVRVRVVLDQRLERTRNQAAYDFLRAHGVQAVWANARYAATHQKTFVIDRSVAVVMSLNMTSRYYPNTRDVAVTTTDPVDVRAIESVFEADFAGRAIEPARGDDLLWSPGAEDSLVALVDAARGSVAVETEVLSDKPVVDALARAARRGVRTTLTMTYQRDWEANFTMLTKAGVSVTYYRGERPLYIHAKVFVVDAGLSGGRAYLGSHNLSAASLLRNRELGIVLTDPAAVASVGVVVAGDAARARPWSR
jgi:cardiolipin synthase